MKPVRFLEEAQDEFLEQISYYEAHQKGLGDRFRETDLAWRQINVVRSTSSVHDPVASQ